MIEYLPLVLTGLGLTASILYYASVLRNANKTQQLQLETRQAQLLMQSYSRLDTPERTKALMEMFTWEFKDFEDYLEQCDPLQKPDDWYNIGNLVIYFDGIGTMVKEGFIDISQVATLIGGGAVYFWSRFDHIKEEIRNHIQYPRWGSETEYLYYELLKYAETHPDFQI